MQTHKPPLWLMTSYQLRETISQSNYDDYRTKREGEELLTSDQDIMKRISDAWVNDESDDLLVCSFTLKLNLVCVWLVINFFSFTFSLSFFSLAANTERFFRFFSFHFLDGNAFFSVTESRCLYRKLQIPFAFYSLLENWLVVIVTSSSPTYTHSPLDTI